MTIRQTLCCLAALAACAGAPGRAEESHPTHAQGSPVGETRKSFTLAAIEYQGTKIWVPGTLIVHLGDKVGIKLVNNIKSEPATHGFAIDEYGIKVVVARGKPETLEFAADKAGLFTIYCQLHPAHIGGQLLVLGRP